MLKNLMRRPLLKYISYKIRPKIIAGKSSLQEEYRKFGMEIPEGGQNSFENALLMYEIMNVSIK